MDRKPDAKNASTTSLRAAGTLCETIVKALEIDQRAIHEEFSTRDVWCVCRS